MTDTPTVEVGLRHEVHVLRGEDVVLRLTPQAALDLGARLVSHGAARLSAQLLNEMAGPAASPRPRIVRCPACGTPRGQVHDRRCIHREDWWK